MNTYEAICSEYFAITMKTWKKTSRPHWLAAIKWRPRYLMTNKAGEYLAIDLILSAEIPHYLYNEVLNIRRKHPSLNLLIIVLDSKLQENNSSLEFCGTNRIGLKSIIPGFGIKTHVQCIVDDIRNKGILPEDIGWFPKEILDRAYNLGNLEFSDVLDSFIDKSRTILANKDATKALVLETIDCLLRRHPGFKNQCYQFMKLSSFENLLSIARGKESDHVIHSFRVFLAGCPIISTFYEHFSNAHREISIGLKDFHVEYAWFLAAVFHDIGRRKEKLLDLFRQQIDDDEDYVLQIKVSKSKWNQQHYMDARRVLGSLCMFVTDEEHGTWDGGAFDDEAGIKLSAKWIAIYNKRMSHGVISAFDFLAGVFNKINAASERSRRAAAIAYSAPAALAILLHDWSIWPAARKCHLFPINAALLPLASLLIYIDTWDDFRRHGDEQCMYIRKFAVCAKGAYVFIEWEDPQRFYEKIQECKNYSRAIRNFSYRQQIIPKLLEG